MREFDGQVVLVTGAGSGIGQSHALHFAELGATVIVHDKNADGIAKTMSAIQDTDGCGVALLCDAGDATRFGAEIQSLVAAVGEVDILVNNVGIPADTPLEAITGQDFDLAFRINVFSFIVAAQSVVPAMKRRRRGKIINTSSNWGLIGHENSSLYASTKAAILGLTKSWARELAPWNINVNCIAPAGINTRLLQTDAARIQGIPLKRHGEPIEVSYLVAFLASEKSNYMTGEVLGLSGGELIVGC